MKELKFIGNIANKGFIVDSQDLFIKFENAHKYVLYEYCNNTLGKQLGIWPFLKDLLTYIKINGAAK